MTSDDLLKDARKNINEGKKEDGVKKLLKAAEYLGEKTEYEQAAKVYEEAALIYRDLYHADECFKVFDKATLMMVRMPQNPTVYKEIVRLNMAAAKIAEAATEFKRAADFYFRAKDFAMTSEEKTILNISSARPRAGRGSI